MSGAAPAQAVASGPRWLPVVLFLAYPAMVHAGIVLDVPALRWLALPVLYVGIFLKPLRAGRAPAWIGLLAFAALTGALMRAGGGMYALYVAPLALLALAFSAFARSLARGQAPLVTRIAEAARGPLAPEIRQHTRRVTQLWAVALALMFAVALLLSITGPQSLWSLFTNVINYVVMALLFAGEYAYRRWRFPDHDRGGFVAYLRLLIEQAPRMRGHG